MWLTYLTIVLVCSFASSDAAIGSITFEHEHPYSLATNCVQTLIEKYYEPHSALTFVKFHSNDVNVLSLIHATGFMSVVNRTPFTKNPFYNKGYLIYAKSAEDFVTNFWHLITEKTWMPYSPFLIVVENLDVTALRDIFQELLKTHVRDAIVLDGSTTDSYTYDPYENNGCGKRFDRIIKFGKCLAEMPPDRFPNKLENILENCTLKLATTDWPPYAIDSSKSLVKAIGIDEYLFMLLAEHEHFKIDISYVDIADKVSVVNDDMVADGPLRWLQTNKYDVVTGGITLVLNRAAAFTYLYGHSAYYDEFRIIVRQAGDMPKWKMIYIEFTPLVWLLLLLSFIFVAVFIMYITKPEDKSFIILSLFDNMLQHSCRIRRTHKTKLILCFWLIFASLITSCYLSGLFGLAAKPIPDYQIKTNTDLEKFNLQPCISKAMRLFQNIVSVLDTTGVDNSVGRGPECATMSNTLKTVSKSRDMYTALPYSLYYSNRYQYYDKSGTNLLYSFRQPLSKIIYASYLSKGFPLYDKFHFMSLRVRETGLIKKVWDDYEYAQKKYYNVTKTFKHPQFHFPIYIIVFGWIVSTICFIGEILFNIYTQAHVLNT